MADKPVSGLSENTSPNDNDFYYTSTPGTPRGDKFIRWSTIKELLGTLNTHTILDEGGDNEVSAEEIRNAIDGLHEQNTDLGTNSPDFTIGFNDNGTVTLFFREDGAAIRLNSEVSPEVLEWTNDGVTWNEFGTGSGEGLWGTILGTLSDQTDLQAALNAKEPSFSKNTAFNKDFGTGVTNIPAIGTTLGNSKIVETDSTGKLITADKQTAYNLPLDTDITSVSSSHDTIPSAKAIKDYVDTNLAVDNVAWKLYLSSNFI
jgi:hypothetical protein